MFGLAAVGTFDSTAVSQLFLAVALILGVARIPGEVACAFGQPPIVGEIAAGVVLGKTVLGRVSPDLYDRFFGEQLGSAADIGLQALLTLAAAMLLLVAGLEVDLRAIRRERKATICVSFASMLLPFGIGFLFAWFLPGLLAHGGDNRLVFSLFIGIALSITALPVIAKILMDLGLQRSDMGVVVLASAVVNDLVGWIGFASVLALAGAGTGNSLWGTIGLTVGFAGNVPDYRPQDGSAVFDLGAGPWWLADGRVGDGLFAGLSGISVYGVDWRARDLRRFPGWRAFCRHWATAWAHIAEHRRHRRCGVRSAVLRIHRAEGGLSQQLQPSRCGCCADYRCDRQACRRLGWSAHRRDGAARERSGRRRHDGSWGHGDYSGGARGGGGQHRR